MDDVRARVAEIEAQLRRMPGVRFASVKTDERGRISEVHLVTGGGKPAKAYVRDVQAVLSAQFGIEIDHRVVSVVEIPDGADQTVQPTPSASGGSGHGRSRTLVGTPDPDPDPHDDGAPVSIRPALTSIAVRSDHAGAAVDVTLTIGTHVLSGTADGPSGQIHRARIVAQATLNALTELLGISAQVESAQVVEAGVREVAVTTLTLEIPRLGEQILCGSALVRGDAEDAVARSVLAAVNRRLAG